MSVNLSPVWNTSQVFTPAGLPMSGGLVYTYLAGSTTPATTYTSNSGLIANSNPIQLQADGRFPNELWLTAGVAYKFVLTDAIGNSIATYDNIVGIVNAPSILWLPTGLTPTYLNSTQFSVAGNQTTVFPVGIRVQYMINTTNYYGTVTAVAFGGSITTVTLAVDSQVLTSGLNTVNVSQFSPVNSAIPLPLPVTFTPTWSGQASAGTTVYTLQTGSGLLAYGLFFYAVNIQITSASGLGNAVIGGFPYPANATATGSAATIINNSGAIWSGAVNTSGNMLVKVATSGSSVLCSTGAGVNLTISGSYFV